MSEEQAETCQVIGSQGVFSRTVERTIRYGDMVAFNTSQYGPVTGRVYGKQQIGSDTLLCVAGLLLNGALADFLVIPDQIYAHTESSQVLCRGDRLAELYSDNFCEKIGTEVMQWLEQVSLEQSEEICRKQR